MPNSHQHSEEGGRFSGGRSVCKRGCANPRQPGSSPIGPSRGLIRRIANKEYGRQRAELRHRRAGSAEGDVQEDSERVCCKGEP